MEERSIYHGGVFSCTSRSQMLASLANRQCLAQLFRGPAALAASDLAGALRLCVSDVSGSGQG